MKTTKKSLWLCAVSMMLCVVMLLGTTFAWFTDSVMNKGNVIQAGELEITVQGYRLVDGKWVGGDYIKEDEPLFTETNWEPGQYGAIFLKVKNQGSLATEVNVDFNIAGQTNNLPDALWYNIQTLQASTGAEGATLLDMLKFKDSRPASENDGVTTLKDIELGDPSLELTLYPEEDKDRYAYYLIEYGMYTSADNKYMDGTVDVDFTVKAKQATVETDGFGSSDYDANATYSVTSQEEMQGAIDRAEDGAIIALANDLTVDDSVVFKFNTAKAVTIDLSGNTITYNNPANAGALVYARNGADVTLQNGTINMDNPYYGLLVNENSSLTVKGVTVNSGDSVIFSNGKNINVVVEDCTLSAQYYAVYHNGSYAPANVTIRNSTILSGGVYVSNSAGREKQTLTIENSTIYGPTAVEMKHTNATITNSTLVGTVAPTGSGSNNNGGCTAGYAFAVTGNGVNDLATGTVVVTDCKFFSEAITDEPNGYYFVYKLAEGSSVTIDGTSVNDFNSYEN